MKPKADLTH